MKTVQQWIQDVDQDELVYAYLLTSPTPFYEIRGNNLSIVEATLRLEKAIRRFILDFLSLPANNSQNDIFFAHPACMQQGESLDVCLIQRNELDGAKVESYDWMMADRADLAGYLIADTAFDEENIISILAKILDEATFLGFTEERFQMRRSDLQNDLKASIEAADRGEVYSLDELWERHGITRPKRDDEEDRRRLAVYEAQRELDLYCRERELNEIRRRIGIKEHPIVLPLGDN